ncbi:DUF1554 domain-containing protein [Leptospira sp. 201903075]|uniref:DUF1554 domain-containing protein n=1 Tax=Leptospira chreensis TaxID=2810035 RepID=UPI0019638FF1|nr:DUF1554 domain-containing protein [Leptospira chreensis]MBM9590134.1 DUF1554 domain-containing protein [Leptospira chreensis]
MHFRLLLIFAIFLHCNEPRLNNQSEFGTDSYLENQSILCLTGQISACKAVTPICTTCKFFSTSTTYNGARGGIAGADAICMNDPKKPTEPARAVYKAFLVDDANRIACTTNNCSGGVSEHVDWILKSDTTYVRAADNVTIATTNSVGIFSGQTNDAELVQVSTILTGLATGGWTTRTSNHCSRWTDGIGSGNAGIANNSFGLNSSTLGNCSASTVIYCVEQ